MADSEFDVLIIGAGLSGIGAAYHFQERCSDQRYAILEARETLGGTWDLFRYPGIRSDSDMFTLGYPFRPWKAEKSIADGPSILSYIRETAEAYGIDRKIRYQHRLISADWSSERGLWVAKVACGDTQDEQVFTCRHLIMCSGYYRYAEGYTPEFAGIESFEGEIVHPQHWPADLDYSNKRVVIVGSGATAVTLLPAMAETAKHVAMLQRSPTYIVPRPSTDKVAVAIRKWLPERLAHALIRWKNVIIGSYFYRVARKQPERAKKSLHKMARSHLPENFDFDKHFTPSYNPWDQRICLDPDGEFYSAISDERASVVTDKIERISKTGFELVSGETLDADIIVMATGLHMEFLGGAEISVDGATFEPSKAFAYKGMMFEGVPNFYSVFGYTNASWTLKCDLTCKYICRLITHMKDEKLTLCVPRNNDPDLRAEPLLDFNSGYVQRALERLPHQGSKSPWKLHQNYFLDSIDLGLANLDDDAMEFR